MRSIGRRVLALVTLVVSYVAGLVVANVQVAWAVLRPDRTYPGIVEIDVRGVRMSELTVLANLISFTPGTFTVEALDSGRLYVHVLHISTVSEVREQILKLEERILAVMR